MKIMIFALVILPAVLALPGSPDEYHDILGLGIAEWRLAFRGTAHVNDSAYDAYVKGYRRDVDDNCKTINWAAPCTSHYRNDDALDNWWRVNEVLLAVIDDGTIVKTIRFNGDGTDYTSWLHPDEYLSSCYTDLKTQPHNYFRMKGQGGARRRFFINRNYNRCQNNAGWFVVTDEDVRKCDWERNKGVEPIIQYAAGNTYTNWNKASALQADAFAVFIKYYPYSGQSSEYFDVLKAGKKEWRLAFRGSAGVGQPVYPAYISGAGIPEDVEKGCMGVDWKAECKSHYRNNDALNNYKWPEIDQVLFGIVDNNAIVKTITFDAKATNYINWFQNAKVVDSCWADFKKGKNIFSIAGWHQRRFFINHKYGGCPNDIGWFIAVDNALKPACNWEKEDYLPALKYAAGPIMTNWSDTTSVKDADAFVIFIRYKSFL